MEKVFANLYRMGKPNRRGSSYTYFLKRSKGNMLVFHQTPPSDEDLDEIEAMGGVESQWVCHSHDAARGSVHKQIQERFGASLHVHQIDRTRVRSKARCEIDTFEGDGTMHGDDFEAFFLPTCTAGHSIYRWKSRGKYYLFTSHAIYLEDGEWKLQFNPHNDWYDRVVPLSKERVDYVFPGYSPSEERGFYQLDERMQKSFAKALRAKRGEWNAGTADGNPLPKTPTLKLAGPAKGLKLDGKLSAAWKRVPALDFIGRDNSTPAQAASCRLAWDEQYLWLCFENDEPEMNRLTAKATERDSRKPAIWDDDAVEIFLCPDDKSRQLCYQFIINANGAILDGKHRDSSTPTPDFKWSSGIEAVAAKQKRKWLVQARIPLADVGLEPKAGRTFALNLCRDRVCGGGATFSQWSPTGQRLHLTPNRFGVVRFGK